jgi:CDP-diacylglycerol--glycerol-3-phosphate 3-phosphatidyltransferase
MVGLPKLERVNFQYCLKTSDYFGALPAPDPPLGKTPLAHFQCRGTVAMIKTGIHQVVMLTLYQVKPTFQRCLRPLVQRLARWGRSPNDITLLASAVSGVGGLAIAVFPDSPYPLLALPGVLLLRLALNAMDGLLARDYALTSDLGLALNELGDAVADVCLYLPWVLIPGVNAPGIIAFVILALLTEFAGLLALVLTQTRAYAGPMGKSDRALVFGILALGLGLGFLPGSLVNGIVVILCALEAWTIANRLRPALRGGEPWR